MKSVVFSVWVMCGIITAVVCATGDNNREIAPSESFQLQQRILELEQRVATLEAALHAVTLPDILDLPERLPTEPPSDSDRDWERREFNGLPYYIVPLDISVNTRHRQ